MTDTRPHILLITTDQLRGDSLGVYGHPCVRTPHLDALAEESVRFTSAYSNCPVCMPARSSLITGTLAKNLGSPNNNGQFRMGKARHELLGGIINAAGYQTAIAGKTHWFLDPSDRGGFEECVSLNRFKRERLKATGRDTNLTGLGSNEMTPGLNHDAPEWQSTHWITDRCLDLIEDRDKTRPLFLWASYVDPHPPLMIHEPYYSMYDDEAIPDPVIPEWAKGAKAPYTLQGTRHGLGFERMTPAHIRKVRGVYYGMISHIDFQIGRLIGKLIKEGLWENTVVVFTSDHGEQLGDNGTFFKGNFTEASARIPLIIRRPKPFGDPRGKSVDGIVELSDLLPTLCDFAGAACPDAIDGHSLTPLLEGTLPRVREELHCQIGPCQMLLREEDKYLYFCEDGAELLFDRRRDRQDLCDLSEDRPLCDPRREALKQRLSSENHPHFRDGDLVNAGKTFEAQKDGNPVYWLGLHGSVK